MYTIRNILPTPRKTNARARPTGVKTFDVSLEKQSAHVVADPGLEYATVLDKIKKTGKKVNSGSADGVAQAV